MPSISVHQQPSAIELSMQRNHDGPFPVSQTVISEDAYISYVQSTSEFWVQIHPALPEEIKDTIDAMNCEGFPALADFSIGIRCLAFYEEFQMWHRAILQTVDKHSVRVFYVDFGNTSVIQLDQNYLKPMPPILADYPVAAVKCCLHMKGPSTDVVEEAFWKIAVGLDCTVQFVEKVEDKFSVHLFDNSDKSHVNLKIGLSSEIGFPTVSASKWDFAPDPIKAGESVAPLPITKSEEKIQQAVNVLPLRSNEKVLEKILEASELMGRGKAHYDDKDYRRAIRNYHKAHFYLRGVVADRQQLPMSPAHQLEMDQIYVNKCRKLIVDCYNNLAACFFHSAMFLKAVTYSKLVLESFPDNVQAQTVLAGALSEVGNVTAVKN